MNTHRRELLGLSAATLLLCGLPGRYVGAEDKTKVQTKQQWLDALFSTRAVVHPLKMGRFADHFYYLTDSIGWYPGANNDQDLPKVSAPTGFVTDLASIPQVFWSLLPPDGNYAYAAVLHDYLYWTQDVSKETADRVLKNAMEDFRVPALTIKAIYEGVHVGGAVAWNQNASLRKGGEKRILRKFPDDPLMTWKNWKLHPDVFV